MRLEKKAVDEAKLVFYQVQWRWWMVRPTEMNREQPELANNIAQPLAPLEVYHVSSAQDHDEQLHGERDAGVQVLHHASRRRRRGGTGAH